MFRISKDPHLKLFYVHKKFLFWWIKWSIVNKFGQKKNIAKSVKSTASLMKLGSYDFSSGEDTSYFILIDIHKESAVIEYFKTSEEFKSKYIEYMI